MGNELVDRVSLVEHGPRCRAVEHLAVRQAGRQAVGGFPGKLQVIVGPKQHWLAFEPTFKHKGVHTCLAVAVPNVPEEENEAGRLLAERKVPLEDEEKDSGSLLAGFRAEV